MLRTRRGSQFLVGSEILVIEMINIISPQALYLITASSIQPRSKFLVGSEILVIEIIKIISHQALYLITAASIRSCQAVAPIHKRKIP